LAICRSDFFAVLNVDGRRERQGWVIWEEEGRYRRRYRGINLS
jgi:hypothetical protein